MRHLRLWRRHEGRTGEALVTLIPIVACALIVLRIAAVVAHAPMEPPWPRGDLQRLAILRKLEQMPGQQLVLVRYGPHHDVDREWVYNDADIGHSKVVWAHDMGEQGNQDLLAYFSGCQVWRIDGDDPMTEPRLLAGDP